LSWHGTINAMPDEGGAAASLGPSEPSRPRYFTLTTGALLYGLFALFWLVAWSVAVANSVYLQVRASMGRVGSCYVNAVAESFFASLKSEIGTRVWATRAEARRAVFAYLTYYNRNRLHSTLKRQTPYEARVCYRQPIALAA